MDRQKTRSVSFGGQTYTLDDRGFLDPSEQWDERFAEGMAESLGIEDGLNDEHWAFVRYVREKAVVDRALPAVVFACIDNGLTLHGFRRLFPMGYFRGACRIAGINYAFISTANFLVTYETDWSSYDGPPDALRHYKLTPTGFLERFADWDEAFATAVAREWKLPDGLTDRHHQIIGFLRDFYEGHGRVPTISETCRLNDINLREFGELFPTGYRRGACRLAGLPYV